MKSKVRATTRPVFSIVLAAAVFFLDLLTPLGYAVWLVYLFPVLFTAWTQSRRAAYLVALLCSVLTGIGFWLSLPGIQTNVALANRSAAILIFWLVAVLVNRWQQAQEAVHTSERRFRVALQNSSVAVFEQDEDLRYTWMYNPTVPGRRVEDFIGRLDSDVTPPDEAERVSGIKRRVLATGQPVREEVALTMGDHLEYLDLAAEPARDADGRIIGVTGAAINITERKRAEFQREAALQERENLIAALQSAKTELQVQNQELLTTQVQLQQANEELEVTAEELRVQNDDLVAAQAKLQKANEEFEVATEELRVQNDELIATHAKAQKANEELEVATEELRVQNEELQTTNRNLVAAQRNLQASEQRYRSLFESMTEGFALHEIVCDERGEPIDYRVLEINPAFERMTGLARANLEGKLRSEIIPGDDSEWIRICGQVALTGQPVHVERHSAALGRDYEVFAYCPAPRYFALLFMDITQRRQMERALEESEKRAREQASQLQAVLDAAPAIIWIAHDRACQTITGNRAAEELLRVPDSTNMSKSGPTSELLAHYRVCQDGVELAPEEMPIQRVAASGQGLADYAMDLFFDDGSERSLLGNVIPVLDPDGRPGGAIAAFLDVTLLRRTQQELAEANTRLQDQNQQLATLLQVSHALASTLKMETLMGLILDHLKVVAPYTDATVYALEGQDLVRLAFRGHDLLPEPGSPLRLALASAPVHAQIVRTQEVVIIPDVWADTLLGQTLRQTQSPLLQARLSGLHSWIGIPLCIQERVIGMLVLHYDRPNFYNARHAELAQAFANQAAVAMENARLYGQAKELAILEERQRIARDLHDAVSQTLFSASIIADVLPTIWEIHPEQARERLQEMRRLSRGAFAEMRMLLLELRPTILAQTSLPDLVTQLVNAVSGRTRHEVSLHLEGDAPLPPDVHVALYRIGQEALNNVVKHAQATRTVVTLRLAQGSAELQIDDNGRGFDPEDVFGPHLGIGIMRERAQSIGARFELTSQPGDGTRIKVTWSGASGRN